MTSTAVLPHLRPPCPEDRESLDTVLRTIGLFRPQEIAIALEVFDGACRSMETGYQSLCAEMNGHLVGWICWGVTPGAEGSVDLYWIVVNPKSQGSGIGTALLEAMERRLPPDARLVRVETSGRPDYLHTRRFYEARGFRSVAVVPEFYAPGDDQVIFLKAMRASTSARRTPR